MVQRSSKTRVVVAGRWRVIFILLIAGLILVVAVPAMAVRQRELAANRLLHRMSQGVAIRYWLANPDQAPAQLVERFHQITETANELRGSAVPGGRGSIRANVFNNDATGLPQDEESVTLCPNRDNVILGGTNDYRGLLDPEGNLTGWHLSLDGGRKLANEGLLPSLEILGTQRPSGGDPVNAASEGCLLYAASLNYDPFSPFENTNGIGVYRSDPDTLAACAGGADPACWPVRRAVAEAAPPHFYDKEWFDVGASGEAGEVVWVTFSDFIMDFSAPLGFTSASVKAVRCDADLNECTDPILISGDDPDVQFSDVTIAPDGRVYVTWAEIIGELELEPQTFIIKMRVAEPGSTEFGPTQIVYEEDLAIPFGGLLHANDFRIATYPKNEVVLMDGHARVFVVWDACKFRLLDAICEEPVIKLTYSDDDGENWSDTTILSGGGDNYFPTIAEDGTGRLAVAWYTNRFDPIFHNQQDIELAAFHAANPKKHVRVRLTHPSNESEADPLLNGFFIGDYIDMAASHGKAFVHFNANYRPVKLFGEGIPVPQQDNYLIRVGMTR